MKSQVKFSLAILALLASAVASATTPLVDSHDTNQTAFNTNTNANTNLNTNTNLQGQAQGQQQGQLQGQVAVGIGGQGGKGGEGGLAFGGTATSGSSSLAIGGASQANGSVASNNVNEVGSSSRTGDSNSATSVNVQTYTPKQAPSVGSAVAPVQVRNCRIGIGAGGSNINGSFTAAIPLGNDQTCLSGAMLEAMQIAGTFTPEEKTTVACLIEGMDKLPTCKNQGK